MSMWSKISVLTGGAVLFLSACGNGVTVSGGGLPDLPALGQATSAMTKDSAGSELGMPYRSEKYVLADGVEAPATSATAYQLLSVDVDAGRVAKLAKALGLDGSVESTSDGFTVTSGTAQLMVYAPGSTQANWSFVADAGGKMTDSVASACDLLPEEGGGGVDASCSVAPTPEPIAPVPGLPSPAEAEAKAMKIVKATGMDDNFVAEAIDSNPYSTTVSLSPRLGGRKVTNMSATVTFGEQAKVQYASGYLGRFEAVGDYPLVGLQEALDRLTSSGAAWPPGAEGGWAPVPPPRGVPSGAEPNKGPDYQTGGSPTDPGPALSAPANGELSPSGPEPEVFLDPPSPPVPYEPVTIEVTGAEVVLQASYPNCLGDPVFVVPAFAFQPEQVGAVLAVTEEHLAGTGAADADEPCPDPSGGPPVPPGRPEPAPEMPVPQPYPATPPEATATTAG